MSKAAYATRVNLTEVEPLDQFGEVVAAGRAVRSAVAASVQEHAAASRARSAANTIGAPVP